MYNFLLLLSVLGSLLFQTTLVDYISLQGVKPDLLGLALFIVAYRKGSFFGQNVGFIAGLFLDFMTNAPLGFYAFIYLCIGNICGHFSFYVSIARILLASFLLGLVLLVKWGLIYILLALFTDEGWYYYFLLNIGYTIIIAPIGIAIGNALYYYFGKINNKEFI